MLITEESTFVGEACHIEAAEMGGPRFNPDSNDEDRRAEKNLMLLCRRHHTEVDAEPATYTTRLLQSIKQEHESANGEKRFKLDESLLFKIHREMEHYWQEVERVHREEHDFSDWAVPIVADRSFVELVDVIRALLDALTATAIRIHQSDARAESDLHDLLKRVGVSSDVLATVPYYENPFVNRHWEDTALALPNLTIRVAVAVDQLEVLFLQEYVGTHPGDRSAASRLEAAKLRLLNSARHAALSD